MDTVDIDAQVWQDDTGRFMRFNISELGIAIQIEMLHVATDSELDDQASLLTAMVRMLPEMMTETLDRAFQEWQEG